MDGDVRMITFVGEERRNSGGGTRSIVVSELGKRKKCEPIVLLIVAVYAEILFQCLVSPFSLTITFRVITGSEMKSHVEGFSERAEKAGDEFRTAVGSD